MVLFHFMKTLFYLSFYIYCIYISIELIKKRDLVQDELRPLYMDFQATTPMVTTLLCKTA